MAFLTFNQIENWYLGSFLLFGAIIMILAYNMSTKEYKNYTLTIIFLFLTIFTMLVGNPLYLWILFLIILILCMNLIFSTYLTKFYRVDEEKLLIDKIPLIWESFTVPPESKAAQEEVS